jgi:hypothetical protein
MTLQNTLLSLAETNALVAQGRLLVCAADESTLFKIDKGNWIGGTIPYFMDKSGGTKNSDKVFVTDFTNIALSSTIKTYSAEQLDALLADRPANGFTYILLPAFSEIHLQYALQAAAMPTIFDSPITGWITGKDLNADQQTPQTLLGSTGQASSSIGLAIHIELPATQYAEIEIVNIFEPRGDDIITFPENTFSPSACFINGQPANLAEYVAKNDIDTRLPLVADCEGALINSSIQSIQKDDNTVNLYGPVLADESYSFAKPIANYMQKFDDFVPDDMQSVVTSCNCILNYLYCELDGKQNKDMTGSFTFGEIAYILLNQTMVSLSIKDR